MQINLVFIDYLEANGFAKGTLRGEVKTFWKGCVCVMFSGDSVEVATFDKDDTGISQHTVFRGLSQLDNNSFALLMHVMNAVPVKEKLTSNIARVYNAPTI